MLLAGVTAGQGVGLSRAMLFLAIENRLEGKMAIGAIDQTEANGIWQGIDSNPSVDFATVLDEVSKLSADIKNGVKDSPLSLAVQRIVVPLEDGAGALARCVLSHRSVLVAEDQDDPFRKALRQAILDPDPVPGNPEPAFTFVCVPLIGMGEKGGQPIGVLMCDNRFLKTEKRIDSECIWDVQTFAAVAAMSIENDKLRKDLGMARILVVSDDPDRLTDRKS